MRNKKWGEILSMQRLQIAKLFFRKARLLEDLPKSSHRQSTWVHGHVGLAAIGVSEHFMAAALSYFYKSGAQELGENFTGGIRHRGYRRGRLATWLRPEPSRRATASLEPTPQSAPEPQRWLLRFLDRESLDRALEYGRNSNLEIQVR